MHCKSCRYSLLNIRGRTCPECGSSFKPSEFEFVIDAVEFQCPHCAQSYYGRTKSGHLEPRTFDCVKCRTRIDMDEMVLAPAEGMTETTIRTGDIPWTTRRGFAGRLAGFFVTMGLAMGRPARIAQGWRENPSVGAALIFAWIILTPLIVAGFVAPFVVNVYPMTPLFVEEYPFVAIWTFTACFAAIGLPIAWACAAHLLLRLTGPTEHGLDATLGVVAYSAGANVLSAIPCVGIFFGWIWWAISCTFMVQAVHRVSGARAAFAALVPPVCFVAVIAASYVGWTAWSGVWGSSNNQGWIYFDLAKIEIVTDALIGTVNTNNGQFPAHAAEMLLNTGVSHSDFIGALTDTYGHHVSVGDLTFDDLDTGMWTASQLQSAIDDTVSALPPDAIAHRFGDFVFVYHGIDYANDDDDLWLVIMTEDPQARVSTRLDPLLVGTKGGEVLEIDRADLLEETDAQNELRAEHGLPPLPDLTTITHDAPAVAATPSGGESEQGQ